jgi:hypothetical protein
MGGAFYLQQISCFSLGISSYGKQYFKSKSTVLYKGVIQRLQGKKERGKGGFFPIFSSNEFVSGDDENRTSAKATETAKQNDLLQEIKNIVFEIVLLATKMIFMYREGVQVRNGVKMHNWVYEKLNIQIYTLISPLINPILPFHNSFMKFSRSDRVTHFLYIILPSPWLLLKTEGSNKIVITPVDPNLVF